jgi:hypothetical protein
LCNVFARCARSCCLGTRWGNDAKEEEEEEMWIGGDTSVLPEVEVETTAHATRAAATRAEATATLRFLSKLALLLWLITTLWSPPPAKVPCAISGAAANAMPVLSSQFHVLLNFAFMNTKTIFPISLSSIGRIIESSPRKENLSWKCLVRRSRCSLSHSHLRLRSPPLSLAAGLPCGLHSDPLGSLQGHPAGA